MCCKNFEYHFQVLIFFKNGQVTDKSSISRSLSFIFDDVFNPGRL